MNSLQKKEKKFNKAIGLVATVVLVEVKEKLVKSKRIWIRKWIKRRDSSGGTNGLLKELEFEDPPTNTTQH